MLLSVILLFGLKIKAFCAEVISRVHKQSLGKLKISLSVTFLQSLWVTGILNQEYLVDLLKM